MKLNKRYFYVSSIRSGDNRKIGITDTKDGIEEFYSLSDVKSILSSGIKVHGLNIGNNGMCIEQISEWSLFLLEQAQGVPMRLQITATSTPKYVIYLDSKWDKDKKKLIHYFFDNSGVEGYFGLSASFISDHKISFNISTSDLNPMAITDLVNKLKERNIRYEDLC